MPGNGVYGRFQSETNNPSPNKKFTKAFFVSFGLSELSCVFHSVLLGTVLYHNPSVWFHLQDQGPTLWMWIGNGYLLTNRHLTDITASTIQVFIKNQLIKIDCMMYKINVF